MKPGARITWYDYAFKLTRNARIVAPHENEWCVWVDEGRGKYLVRIDEIKTMEQSAHSRIPPSSAYIWAGGGCTGWPKMMESVPPSGESDESAEGTASHEVGRLMIWKALHGDIGPELTPGDTAQNGVIIDMEMVESAEIYADDAIAEYRMRVVNGGLKYGLENKVDCPSVHPESFGTPDFWMYDPSESLLIVWDYKYGHLVVDAYENWQLANYTAGLVTELAPTEVEFRICQPRAFRPRNVPARWRVPISRLEPMFGVLRERAAEAMGPNGVCRSGKHCRRCDARTRCETALTADLTLFEAASAPVPIELSVQALGLQLHVVTRAIEALTGLKTGYEEQVSALIRGGQMVPWWALEPVAGREAWTKPVAEVTALGDLLGINLRKEALITPNQARKAGLDNATLALYSGRNSGLKLVFDTGDKARKVFEPMGE